MWLAILVSVTFASCKSGTKPEAEAAGAPVKCITAKRTALRNSRTLRGSIVTAPDDDVSIAPQVAGRLISVPVREGDSVPVGAVVAEVGSAARCRCGPPSQSATCANRSGGAKCQHHGRAQSPFVQPGLASKQQMEDAAAHQKEAEAAV